MVSQEHLPTPVLCGKRINKIPDDLDIVYTHHASEVSIEEESSTEGRTCAD
jgi:hypothetical protein